MDKQKRLPAALVLGSVATLLAMLAGSHLSIMGQHNRMREIYHEQLPLLLVHAQGALWNFRHAVSGQHRGTDQAEAVRKTYLTFKENLGYLTTGDLANEFGQVKNGPAALAALVGALDRMEPRIAALTDGQAINRTDIEDDIELAARTLLELHIKTQETLSSHIALTISQISSNDIFNIILFMGIMFIGAATIIFAYKENDRARRAAAAAQEAQRRNALFAAAIDATAGGVIITDPNQPDNPIIFVNQGFTQIAGYTSDEVVGKNCRMLQGSHTDSLSARTISHAVKHRKPVSTEILNYRKDGTPFWNALSISPVFNEYGGLVNFIGMQTDITDIKNTQEALRLAKSEAERGANMKSNFLAMMSHEIRTPINSILGALSLMHDTAMNEEQKRYVATASTSGAALLEIINDLLDYSKIEAGKLEIETEAFNLPALLSGIVDMLQNQAKAKGLYCNHKREPDVPTNVMGDPGRVRQILLNLVSNAVKFTETGGIMINVSNLISYDEAGGTHSLIRFEVVDTGIGINHEGQSRLFTEFNQLDPSTSRKHGGTGLGLAICRRLVKLMNGEIGVESRPGEGSKFWFVIPFEVTEKETTGAKTQQPDAQTPTIKGRILLVEDNEPNQIVIAGFLRKAGHRVDIAGNGLMAIEKAQTTPYDLVLMDISMPEMDGMTATREIRALGMVASDLPIIAMTALAMAGDRERCIAAGMNDYIRKPIERRALEQTVQRWLRKNGCGETRARESACSGDIAFASPVLDRATVKQMIADLDKTIVLGLIDVFLRDLETHVARVHAAVAANDWDAVQREAHSMKSSSANCGLMALSCSMQEIEDSLRARNTNQAKHNLTQAEGVIGQSFSALADLRDQLRSEEKPV
ncbi:MAG: response regulator [Alphaproteobacteria bacterium]|nr:response regulator [Alphaproteobacteria bacterium]